MNQHIKTVAIVGVGLIGGSFALALRKAGFAGRIIGVSSPETIAKAKEMGVIDQGASVGEAASVADLVYLAQPIQVMLSTLHMVDTHVRPGTLITDAGSTKREIVRRAAKDVLRGVFLGGHPMAGKESSGIASADANLFQDRPYVLTPVEGLESSPAGPVAEELKDYLREMGARLVLLDPEEHDRLVATISHLPQLLSTALGAVLAGEPDAAQVAGPAAADMTRLAMSPYRIWQDIFATNAGPIDEVLSAYIAKLEQLRRDLQKPELEQSFEQAASAARALRAQR